MSCTNLIDSCISGPHYLNKTGDPAGVNILGLLKTMKVEFMAHLSNIIHVTITCYHFLVFFFFFWLILKFPGEMSTDNLEFGRKVIII